MKTDTHESGPSDLQPWPGLDMIILSSSKQMLSDRYKNYISFLPQYYQIIIY
jgi:hypothetical protein